jgi:hypothetical protein
LMEYITLSTFFSSFPSQLERITFTTFDRYRPTHNITATTNSTGHQHRHKPSIAVQSNIYFSRDTQGSACTCSSLSFLFNPAHHTKGKKVDILTDIWLMTGQRQPFWRMFIYFVMCKREPLLFLLLHHPRLCSFILLLFGFDQDYVGNPEMGLGCVMCSRRNQGSPG